MCPVSDTSQTAEGTRLQLHSEAGKTDAVVVSTLMEAWQVVKAGLFRDGVVKDVSCMLSPPA
jgi:D-serine ammonia-lyase